MTDHLDRGRLCPITSTFSPTKSPNELFTEHTVTQNWNFNFCTVLLALRCRPMMGLPWYNFATRGDTFVLNQFNPTLSIISLSCCASVIWQHITSSTRQLPLTISIDITPVICVQREPTQSFYPAVIWPSRVAVRKINSLIILRSVKTSVIVIKLYSNSKFFKPRALSAKEKQGIP